jgi:hypothetical protein
MSQIDLSTYKPAEGHALVLKSIAATLVAAHKDFQWPETGHVEAPDWKPTESCGNGLHGWLWGEGDADLRCTDSDAKWMVLSVPENPIINLDGKVKFPACEVLYCGERDTAVLIIQHHAPAGTKVIFGTATAGDSGTATAGDIGTATAGYSGTATAGNIGTATAGNSGTATAGYRGTATAGYSGTATAGDRGTATAGYRGTATAGDDGVLVILHYDQAKSKYVKKIALVDGVNYLPGQKYKLNEAGEFVPATDQ